MRVKRTGVPGLVMVALAGLIMPAGARAECPELERLQSAFVEAWEHAGKASAWEICASYRRLSLATKAWVEHARQNAGSCRLSGLLSYMEHEYVNVLTARDNVCSGRASLDPRNYRLPTGKTSPVVPEILPR